MLSAFFQVASYTPDISQKASDILKSNELLYITGNPRLKNSRVTNLNLSYSCIPSNALSVQAFAQGQLLFKKYMQYYSPHEGGVALLRDWTNSGNFFSGVVGAAFNLKLLQGNLQIYASPNVYLYDATGLYGTSCYPFMLRAQATYYLGDFYFMGYYQTRQKYLMWQTTVKVTNRNYHFLSLGWGHGSWNLSVTATNFLHKGWKTSDMEFVSDLYTDHTVAYGTTYHPRLELSATYTFGYGKKVQRGNEVGEQGGAESAIMK